MDLPCGVEWGACERCLGSVLSDDRRQGQDYMTCSRCGGSWPKAEVSPCPRSGTSEVASRVDKVCESHAAYERQDATADNVLLGCSVFLWIFGAAALLAVIYLAIRFVHWAWSTPIS
jgi:hypothetical protein